jgi:dTDP-4-amino-4,6-dideoxygalactose transaminase
MRQLALLGDDPAFPAGLQFARPPFPPLERVVARLAPSYNRGVLTNGPLVREVEAFAAEMLGVRHVVAVSSCTAGLMLSIGALCPEGDRSAVVPSFTFSASAHALAWNRLTPVFAECDPDTFYVDVDHLRALARDCAPALVMGVPVFGAPGRPEDVEAIGRDLGVPVIFDSAHGLGATQAGRSIGSYGDAEVFSLSPTKPVTAGEGGLVATNRSDVAERVRLGRDYGNPGNYDTQFAGINARMSELHAAVALESFDEHAAHMARRAELAEAYLQGLAEVPGISTQRMGPDDRSTWKDFTISVGPALGVPRDLLVTALRADGIDTRNYFDPPVHRQRSHRVDPLPHLPITDAVSASVISLPLWREMTESDVAGVVGVIAAAHERAGELAAAVPS